MGALSARLLTRNEASLLLGTVDIPMLRRLHVRTTETALDPLIVARSCHFLLPSCKGERIRLDPVRGTLCLLFLGRPRKVRFGGLISRHRRLFTLCQGVNGEVSPSGVARAIGHLAGPLSGTVGRGYSHVGTTFFSLVSRCRTSCCVVGDRIGHRRNSSVGL